MARETAVETLAAEQFDVLVVGGGITGAGVALDAADRGLTVALVERRDFASGSSSRSSKLLHGGLRYLRGLHLRMVREALRERELMLELAPRLVRRLPLVIPALGPVRPARSLGAALTLYDLLAIGQGSVPARHRTLSESELVALVPALGASSPPWGYLFHDCQADDVRLVLTVLAEAERRGAVCANRLEAVELIEQDGRLAAVAVRDTERGGCFAIAADRVVDATGVRAGRLSRGSGRDAPRIRPSRGAHILLASRDLALNGAGVVLPAAGARHVLALPWLGRVLVGATDDYHHGELDDARPSGADVDYLLEAVNASFGTALGRVHVAGAFAGIRPLVRGRPRGRSADLSRRVELHVARAGTVTVTGGKLTTWRQMARRAVDVLVAHAERRAPCRTHEIELAARVDPRSLPRLAGLPEPAREHLAQRYGRPAAEVLDIARTRREAAAPIVDGRPDLLAEAVYAARHEQARTVGDVLLRRTRLGLVAAREVCEPGAEPALRVARAMAPELGWSGPRAVEEARAWAREARAEGLVVDTATDERTIK